MVKANKPGDKRMDFQLLADKALQGIIPEREEMKAVLNASDEQIPSLSARPSKCVIIISASGYKFTCSKTRDRRITGDLPLLFAIFRIRGAHRSLSIPLEGTTFEGAKRAKEAGAVRFCIVNSGRGPTNKEIQKLPKLSKKFVQKSASTSAVPWA